MPVGGMKPWDTISKNCAGNFFATKKQLPVFPLEMRCFTGGNLQSDEQGTCDRQLLDVGHHKSDGVCGDPLLSAEASGGRRPVYALRAAPRQATDRPDLSGQKFGQSCQRSALSYTP